MTTFDELQKLYSQPFMELLNQAHQVHRENFNPNEVQLSQLLSIKTGGCPEDCAYCPQSAHYATGVKSEPLMTVSETLKAARAAKDEGATRFCMGAAWRSPSDKDLEKVCEMVSEVNKLGLETCVTLGMLNAKQSARLKEAGLDYYNHNIDSSADFYEKIISTRKFDERIDTLTNVAAAGIKVCCGGILGMGESVRDRLEMLLTLKNLPQEPESIPINFLIPIANTPLQAEAQVDSFDFVRLIAVARLAFPRAYIRLAAGREKANDEFHALAFFAGVNSVFLGDKLLTAKNSAQSRDESLMARLNLKASAGKSADPAGLSPFEFQSANAAPDCGPCSPKSQ